MLEIVRLPNLVRLLFILSPTASLIVLYLLYPGSFEVVWKGRAYYIFFLWLILFEIMLDRRKINTRFHSLRSKRFLTLLVVSSLPTVYVLVAFFSGLNTEIINVFPKHYGMSIWAENMPLTVEYIVLASFFSLTAILAYGREGLKHLILPFSFLWAVGMVFLIDNLYPFGEFIPFQILVPATSTLVANVLSLIGYNTKLEGQIYGVTVLRVWGDKGAASLGIAWPCSGVESLIIYSVITALFLKDGTFPRRQKIIYFLAGAVITYLINIIRIANIFIIAIEYGVSSQEVRRFHDYYGPLYSITWIIAYQLMIVATQFLWNKVRPKTPR